MVSAINFSYRTSRSSRRYISFMEMWPKENKKGKIYISSKFILHINHSITWCGNSPEPAVRVEFDISRFLGPGTNAPFSSIYRTLSR